MRILITTFITYSTITFLWAMIYNELIFDNALSQMAVGWRDTPLYPLGFLTMAIQSVAIFVLYTKFYSGERPFKDSFELIFIVGVFDICYASFIEPATFEVNPVWKYVTIKLAYSTIHFALVGLAMVYIFQTPKRK